MSMNGTAPGYWTRRHVTVEITDSGGTYSVIVPSGEGDVSIDGFEEGNATAVVILNRGGFEGFVEGDDVTQAFSVTCRIPKQALSSTRRQSIFDAIYQTGSWANAITCDPLAEKWAHKVVIRMAAAGAESEVILLPCVRSTVSIADGEVMTLSLSGTNYKAPLLGTAANAALNN
jgi:hypothetical protein